MYETDGWSVSGETIKKLFQEIKNLKYRISKLENEITLLHEHNETGRNANAISSLPKRIDFANVPEENDLRWRLELPKRDYKKSEMKATDVAMMISNQAWYGDVFLFEMICQYKGCRPKENNWFNSVFPFHTVSQFSKFILSQKWFHHTCILSIGYSDIFKFSSFSDEKTKWVLHQMLNHMRDNGAERVKVLSLPPARQMMKNIEYLRLCQTNNRILINITETHTGVQFINLDSFFLKNSDESFSYFENGEISVEILDNLLMKKEDDNCLLFIESELTKCLIDYIVNFTYKSTEFPFINRKLKGWDTRSIDQEEEKARHCNEKPRPTKKRRRKSRARELEKRNGNLFCNEERDSSLIHRQSSVRNREHHSSFTAFHSSRRNKSPRKLENRFFHPDSSSASVIDDRNGSSRYDRRVYENSFDSEELSNNASLSHYLESEDHSKNRNKMPYDERIVSKSLTEVRLVRYAERKSISPPPWLKNNSFISASPRLAK